MAGPYSSPLGPLHTRYGSGYGMGHESVVGRFQGELTNAIGVG
jgi:hypothetical protein